MKNLLVAMVGVLMVGLSASCYSYGGDLDTQCCRQSIGSKLCATVCLDNPWSGYIDTVLLGRDQTYAGDLVMRSGSPVTVALSGTDLDFDSATGLRVGFYRSLSCCRELELLFTGMGNWQSEGFTTGNNDLFLPGNLGALPDFTGADAFASQYTSGMRSFEANVVREKHGIKWLAGFRYLKLDEAFSLTSFDFDSFDGEYTIQTDNSLYGGQLGCRWERAFGRTAFGVSAKSGIFGNQAEQRSRVEIQSGTNVVRDRTKADQVVANVSEITLNSDFVLTDCINLRLGLDLLWASDLALAPNQLDFSDDATSSDFVDTSGSVFMQGAHIGLSVVF